MRNLLSGIIGVVFGGFILTSGRPQGEGAYYQGQLIGLMIGLLLFFGGFYYLYKAFVELKPRPKKKRKGREKEETGSSRRSPGADL